MDQSYTFPLDIRFSETKVYVLALISILCLSICSWLVFTNASLLDLSSLALFNPITFYAFGLSVISLISLITLIYSFVIVIRNKPLLRIQLDGIYDNSHMLSSEYFIDFDNIQEVGMFQIGSKMYLGLDLKRASELPFIYRLSQIRSLVYSIFQPYDIMIDTKFMDAKTEQIAQLIQLASFK